MEAFELFSNRWNEYFPNSPGLFLFCIGTSVFAVIAAFVFTRGMEDGLNNKQKEEDDDDETTNVGLQARYKLAKQKVVEEKLTPEQQLEEKRSEVESLQAIYKLLQERKDVFPDATMDDIKSQLSLYKNIN